MTTDLDYMLQVCFPVQGDSKPLTVICLVGSGVASSDKAVCLINTLTAALSGQSHSSSLLKWLRKSLWPFGDWYSNFPLQARWYAQRWGKPSVTISPSHCLSLSLSLISSPYSLHFLHRGPLPPNLSFSSPPRSHLCTSGKYNITCILLHFLNFFSPPLLCKNNLAGNADFSCSHHFSVKKETLWLVKTGIWQQHGRVELDCYLGSGSKLATAQHFDAAKNNQHLRRSGYCTNLVCWRETLNIIQAISNVI